MYRTRITGVGLAVAALLLVLGAPAQGAQVSMQPVCFSVTNPAGSQSTLYGRGATGGVVNLITEPPDLTSAYGDGDAFVATFRWVETPFVATLSCRVDNGRMTVDGKLNVSFGPTEFTEVSE